MQHPHHVAAAKTHHLASLLYLKQGRALLPRLADTRVKAKNLTPPLERVGVIQP